MQTAAQDLIDRLRELPGYVGFIVAGIVIMLVVLSRLRRKRRRRRRSGMRHYFQD